MKIYDNDYPFLTHLVDTWKPTPRASSVSHGTGCQSTQLDRDLDITVKFEPRTATSLCNNPPFLLPFSDQTGTIPNVGSDVDMGIFQSNDEGHQQAHDIPHEPHDHAPLVRPVSAGTWAT